MITPLEALVGKGITHTLVHKNDSTVPLSRAVIDRYQGEQLAHLIEYCRKNSAFYRQKFTDAGISRVSGLEDLASLPLTCEEELRNHGSEMVCVSQDEVARIVTMQSSGTTGPPKRLFFTGEDLERTLDFFHQGMQPLVDPGQKVAILLPGATPDSTGHLLAQALKRMRVVSDIVGLVDNPEQTARKLSEIQPDVLVGFPVQILAIAQIASALTIPIAPIRSVLLCSDYIPTSLSSRLQKVLGCQIFTHYGTVETGLGGGVDCKAHQGTHLREADLLFEIIDPDAACPLPDGQWGEIVFTTLNRTGMPLIRYRSGDMGRLLSGPCRCGSHIRRLDKVLGRINQRRTLQNGSQLGLHTLDENLFSVSGLLDFRASLAVVKHQDLLRIDLVVTPGMENAVLRQCTEILTNLQATQNLQCNFTIDSTSTIHRGKRILEEKREGKRT